MRYQFVFSEAARDLQLVQISNSEGSTTSSLRGRRRQSPHPHERNYRGNVPQRQNVYDESSLQNSIYRKFEETETLLDQLRIQEGFGANHTKVHNLKKAFLD